MSNQMTSLENVTNDNLFMFSKGILGFNHLTDFLVIKQDEYFSYLQSVQDPAVTFIITDPFHFYPHYEFEIPREILEEYDMESQEALAVRCIVTWHSQREKVTLNLLAPLLFNTWNRKAKQFVLQSTAYTTKHVLYAPNTESGGS